MAENVEASQSILALANAVCNLASSGLNPQTCSIVSMSARQIAKLAIGERRRLSPPEATENGKAVATETGLPRRGRKGGES